MSPPADPENALRQEVASGLKRVRDEARKLPPGGRLEGQSEGSAPVSTTETKPLERLNAPDAGVPPSSPDRRDLNAFWDVASGGAEPSGIVGRLVAPLRGLLRRLLRFALGPVVERQVRMNSAQVRFDNELVHYVDQRFDRMSRHYDEVLGLHGKRMEEIDERHLILQQELIRHVHDLVSRIEFVFESAEQNHLYLEGMLRESREELSSLAEKLRRLSEEKR